MVCRDVPAHQIGPFRVIDIDGKWIHVDDEGSLVQYSIVRVKRYTFKADVVQQLRQDDMIVNRALGKSATLQRDQDIQEQQTIV